MSDSFCLVTLRCKKMYYATRVHLNICCYLLIKHRHIRYLKYINSRKTTKFTIQKTLIGVCYEYDKLHVGDCLTCIFDAILYKWCCYEILC